jgi:hypothetical protein
MNAAKINIFRAAIAFVATHIVLVQMCFFYSLPETLTFSISKVCFAITVQLTITCISYWYLCRRGRERVSLKTVAILPFALYFSMQMFLGSVNHRNGDVVLNDFARKCLIPIQKNCFFCIWKTRSTYHSRCLKNTTEF